MRNLLEIVLFQMVPIGHALIFDLVIVPTLEHIVSMELQSVLYEGCMKVFQWAVNDYFTEWIHKSIPKV